MENIKKNTRMAWIMAAVWSVITIYMLFFVPAWFWVPLPFMLTYIIQGMDWM